MVKKIISLSLSTMLLSQSALGVVTELCEPAKVVEYFPMGDSSGKSVLIKKEVSQECNVTISEQGPCTKWKEDSQTFGVAQTDYNTYRTHDNSESINELFATIGVYDQLEHLWSGWHGYCEKGTKSDFSWASDPGYWASLAASTAMDYASGGAGSEGNALQTGAESAKDSAMSGIQSLGTSVGLEISENMAGCLVTAGVDLTFAAARSRLSDGSSPDCDPVDEFCEEEEVQEEEIMTLKLEVYNELIKDEKYKDMIIIIPPIEGDVVSVRYKRPTETDGFEDMSQDEQQAIKDELNALALKIDVAMAVGGLAYCGVTGSSASQTNVASSGDDDRMTGKAAASMGINMIPSAAMGPYGPLIKAGMQVLLSVGTSFKHVNSCSDEEDAIELGSRHEKTQSSLQYNLCHMTSKTCAEEPLVGNGCALAAYNYCCYDQALTKILSEQLKVQLGRDWRHCTGISIKDLKFVSFRECDAEDKKAKDASGKTLVDGVKTYDVYSYPGKSNVKFDPTTSYQYVRKCINMDEFKDIINDSAKNNIDMTDFKEAAKHLSGN